MRRFLAFAAFALLAACETQPVGGRCTENFDCDRTRPPGTPQYHCVARLQMSVECSGSSGDCICCPLDPTQAAMVPGNICTTSGTLQDVVILDTPVVTDAPTDVATDGSDASDVTSDALDASACGATCAQGTYCDPMNPAAGCQNQKPIGAVCTQAFQCQTGFCVDGFCCNSACQGPGLSCGSDPNFAGLCMSVVPPADAMSMDAVAE